MTEGYWAKKIEILGPNVYKNPTKYIRDAAREKRRHWLWNLGFAEEEARSWLGISEIFSW